MAMTIEVRQVTNIRRALIDLKKAETTKGYRSCRNRLLHEKPHLPITVEYLIDTLKLLSGDKVLNSTQDDLLDWPVNFCFGVISGKTVPQIEGE